MAAQHLWPHGGGSGPPEATTIQAWVASLDCCQCPGISGSGTGRTRGSPSTCALFTQLLQQSSGNFLAGINLGYKWPCLQLPLREVTFPTCKRRLHPGGVHGGLGSEQRAQKTHWSGWHSLAGGWSSAFGISYSSCSCPQALELGGPAGWQGPSARGWLAGQGCRTLGSSHRAGGTHRPRTQWLPAVF